MSQAEDLARLVLDDGTPDGERLAAARALANLLKDKPSPAAAPAPRRAGRMQDDGTYMTPEQVEAFVDQWLRDMGLDRDFFARLRAKKALQDPEKRRRAAESIAAERGAEANKRTSDLSRLVLDESTTDGERLAAARALAKKTLSLGTTNGYVE